MTNESNQDAVITLRQMVVIAQQLLLLDVLEDLRQATLLDDTKPSNISPAIKALNELISQQ